MMSDDHAVRASKTVLVAIEAPPGDTALGRYLCRSIVMPLSVRTISILQGPVLCSPSSIPKDVLLVRQVTARKRTNRLSRRDAFFDHPAMWELAKWNA